MSNARLKDVSPGAPISSDDAAGSFRRFSPRGGLFTAADASAIARFAPGVNSDSIPAVACIATEGGGFERIRSSCRRRSLISRIVFPCRRCSTQNFSAALGSSTPPAASNATSALAALSASLFG
eukprot:31535-Pelagococcus_subviridis.AAC.3